MTTTCEICGRKQKPRDLRGDWMVWFEVDLCAECAARLTARADRMSNKLGPLPPPGPDRQREVLGRCGRLPSAHERTRRVARRARALAA